MCLFSPQPMRRCMCLFFLILPQSIRACVQVHVCLWDRRRERERWASWGTYQQGRNSFLWSDSWQQAESAHPTGPHPGCRWLGCLAAGEAGAHTPHSVPLPRGAPPEFAGQPGSACLWPTPTKWRLLIDSDFIWKGIRPHFKTVYGDFSGGQWIRICLPMQGTQVWSLIQEDPPCRGTAKPVCHNYWAQVPTACVLQQEKSLQWEACAVRRRVGPARRN